MSLGKIGVFPVKPTYNNLFGVMAMQTRYYGMLKYPSDFFFTLLVTQNAI